VAPPLRAEAFFDRHEVYLPYPDEWFPINLYPDEPLGTALNPAIGGGSRIFCKCNISLEDDHIPRITPMYIREGQFYAVYRMRNYTTMRQALLFPR
jgi:hypothetical protein